MNMAHGSPAELGADLAPSMADAKNRTILCSSFIRGSLRFLPRPTTANLHRLGHAWSGKPEK